MKNENITKFQNYVEQNESTKRLSYNTEGSFSDNREALNFFNGLADVIQKLNSQLILMTKNGQETSAEYKKVSEAYNTLINNSKKFNESISAKDMSKMVKDVDKIVGKIETSVNKSVKKSIDAVYTANQMFIDSGLNYEKIMKKMSQDLNTSINDSMSVVRRDLTQLWQSFNINKIATGLTGSSVSDLRDMQQGIKSTLGLSNNEFTTFQTDLFNQTTSLNDKLDKSVFSMQDVASTMKIMKDINVRDQNWAAKQYQAILVSNKYLGLSSNSMTRMLNTASSINDEMYATKQAQIIAGLASDKTSYTDVESLSQWNSDNMLQASGKFNSPMDVMAGFTAAIESSQKLFGKQGSAGYESILTDIVGMDMPSFGQKYQGLLSHSPELMNLLQSGYSTGNMDPIAVSKAVVSALQNANSKAGKFGKTYFEQLGLDSNIYQSSISAASSGSSMFNTIDKNYVATKKDLKDSLGKLDTTSWWEEITSTVNNLASGATNFFGLDWSTMLGFVQGASAVTQGALLLSNIKSTFYHGVEVALLKSIATSTAIGASTDKLTSGSKFLDAMGKGGLLKTIGKVALPVAGGVAALGDFAAGTKDNGILEGLKRGINGTADYKNKSFGDNLLSIGGNAAKWAAIGSIIPGIGTAAGVIGGGIFGLLSAITGGFQGNTVKGEGGSYGYGGTGDYLASRDKGSGYPWEVGSGYGKRHVFKNGVETNDWGWHTGFDFWKYSGAALGANTGGTISKIYKSNGSKTGYGNGIQLLGDDGMLYEYGHMLNAPLVQIGDRVESGDTVGFMGSTGNSTGTHLHLTVRNRAGEDVYPGSYVKSGLFSANGEKSTGSTAGVSKPSNESSSSLTSYLQKDKQFSSGSGGYGGDYAKSSDFDRLIETLSTLNNSKKDKQDMLRAIASKNAFARN